MAGEESCAELERLREEVVALRATAEQLGAENARLHAELARGAAPARGSDAVRVPSLEHIPDAPGSAQISASQKVLGSDCFLFDRVMLFGFCDKAGTPSPELLYAFENAAGRRGSHDSKETADLLRFVFAPVLKWKFIAQTELSTELQELLFNGLEQKRVQRYVFKAAELGGARPSARSEPARALNESDEHHFVCLQFSDMIHVGLEAR